MMFFYNSHCHLVNICLYSWQPQSEAYDEEWVYRSKGSHTTATFISIAWQELNINTEK